jgi:hypothetical protein
MVVAPLHYKNRPDIKSQELMLQPFEPFKDIFLKKLVVLKRTYLVSQTYPRGYKFAGEGKTALLLTDYDDRGLARVHLNAVKDDRYAAVIDLSNVVHAEKLQQMLSDDSGYLLFWAVIKSSKELEDRVEKKYTDAIRRYVQEHTTWRIGRDAAIRSNLQVIFGSLHLVLKYAGQTLRVKFEEVEKYS